MPAVADVSRREQRVRAVPAQVADVEHVPGVDMLEGEDRGARTDEQEPPASMKLPTETLQQIYSLLSPIDFDAARHTCRSWFLTSLDRSLLAMILRRGGWWSSVVRILAHRDVVSCLNFNQESIMSKWLSRECKLANPRGGAFHEVGQTDFCRLVPGATVASMNGAMIYSVSQCGRYLMLLDFQHIYLYELNHTCPRRRSRREMPLEHRKGLPLGLLRPVTQILCPRRVIACSMDTSAGRCSIAILMEGRQGIVRDLTAPAMRRCTPTTSFTSNHGSSQNPALSAHLKSSVPPCRDSRSFGTLQIEDGPRSVYRNICQLDDPPRSVAICPQRNCVAFGYFNRWFPLSSPSDYLYFLPPRRGVDTAKKLRLISSASGMGEHFLRSLGEIVHEFSSALLDSGSSAIVSWMGRRRSDSPPGAQAALSSAALPTLIPTHREVGYLEWESSSPDGFFRKVTAGSADHYRAIPLSDGYHILFTDPRSGSLCLGTDAPAGSLTRLLRKIWFRPPLNASSPVPILYSAGADTSHGVRVVASFATSDDNLDGTNGSQGVPEAHSSRQVVMFYTVPADLFRDISRTDATSQTLSDTVSTTQGEQTVGESMLRRQADNYRAIDISSKPYNESMVYPVELTGQPVALDGSTRNVDLDGDVSMADITSVKNQEAEDGVLPRLDGAQPLPLDIADPAHVEEDAERVSRQQRLRGPRSIVSVNVVEEADRIARMDVTLR
ncbi:hypothetical protein S40293_03468 [Stachybotrys chartarum IBT 40293]|nr:hypothetical protein S40293_03468 [Stachybotrys chartarum IBT 40293]